jgi:hypothetical protein
MELVEKNRQDKLAKRVQSREDEERKVDCEQGRILLEESKMRSNIIANEN